jgi:ferritin-like metal-binding protein YciE
MRNGGQVTPNCGQVLQQHLAEEKAADEKLTTLAENEVNRAAA